ncbi:glycosyltransferase [Kordiimonas sp.]|uniref:glycosyltransferase n=1 Tax=Kordiimonas sp. TaxID=1970157 RepID=UPI003A8F2B5A
MTGENNQPLHIVLFGTADLCNARIRIMLEGLMEAGVTITYCHQSIWSNATDRAKTGKLAMVGLAARWLWAMLVLSVRYLSLPRHDLVLVSYPGHADIWFARAVSSLRRKPLVWDAFISAYDTVVTDRRLAGPHSLAGRLCFFADRMACRFANLTILDTPAHASFFAATFHITREKFAAIPVGAEAMFRSVAPARAKDKPNEEEIFRVLFYGKFIPLHGIPTILEASKRLQDSAIEITLVGTGQTAGATESWIKDNGPPNLQWLKWVDYEQLPAFISSFHIGLGIFSAGEKAGRVIPNKVYQMLACGLPVITRQSDAMDTFSLHPADGLTCVPAEDPEALAAAIREARERWQAGRLEAVAPSLVIGAGEVGSATKACLHSLRNGV